MRISDWSSDVCSSDLATRLGHVRRGRLLLLVEDPRHLRPEVAQPLLLQYQARPHHPGTGPPAAEVVRGWLGTGEDAELPRVHARRVPSARLQPNGPLRILFGSSGPRAGRHPVRLEGSYRCLYAGHRPLGAAPYSRWRSPT